jgi:hypothetical protein
MSRRIRNHFRAVSEPLTKPVYSPVMARQKNVAPALPRVGGIALELTPVMHG